MAKILFTEKQQKELAKNLYVKAVSEKANTDEFKRLFITENEKGKLPRAIFEEAGFDVEIIGIGRIHSSGKRWRAAYRERGDTGLEDTRKYSSGRPLERELSLEERYTRLEAQNRLLQAENELLKKIELAERMLLKKKSNS